MDQVTALVGQRTRRIDGSFVVDVSPRGTHHLAGATVVVETLGGVPEHTADIDWLRERLG